MKTGQEAPDIWRHRASEAVATNKSLDIEETIDHQAYLFKIEPAPSEGYVNVYGTDVTERKRIENQLREVERFASIGRTAAMIGHDLRNPLQGIVGTISLLTERVAQMKCTREERQRLAESLEEINQLTFYMDKIVSDLQDYARPVKPNPAKFDLSRLVQGAILSCRIPDKVSVDVRIPKNQTTVTLDAAIIRRVLTNLINNSVQAMPEGGKLTITASQKKKPHSITITVEDTGIGISREDKRKVFTPLFTTKSKGQGLGLPVCKRLVEAMNGTINFESEKGKGTKFTIQLP
jgi:signal transduction histidine kinase